MTGVWISSHGAVVAENVLSVVVERPIGYFAAVLCDFLRQKWISARKSFTCETVMSGPDKIGLFGQARGAGFRTYLYFISTDSPNINTERVALRVSQGGHEVPFEKIISRYERSLGQLRTAIRLSDRAYLFDNSGRMHRLIAEYDGGKLVQGSKDLPGWFAKYAPSET